MVVSTESPEIRQARRVATELLVLNHQVDCLECNKSIDCKLQKIISHVGIENGLVERLKRTANNTLAIDDSNPFFYRDPNKCVLCGICVRTCKEINGVDALDLNFRDYWKLSRKYQAGNISLSDIAVKGDAIRIAGFNDKPIAKSTCESCGECLVRCPTGAFISKTSVRTTREVKTTCPYCGTGCGIYLGVRGDRVLSARGDRNSPVNKGRLCVKGRFAYNFVNHPDRLTTPLIRRNGILVEASWDEALDLIATKFRQAQDKYGPQVLGGLSSARVTNEDNYLFQKLMRSLGTNSIDQCARL
jgi:formate dehydrogenase major subunit